MPAHSLLHVSLGLCRFELPAVCAASLARWMPGHQGIIITCQAISLRPTVALHSRPGVDLDFRALVIKVQWPTVPTYLNTGTQ